MRSNTAAFRLFYLLLFFLPSSLFAQINTGYYNDTTTRAFNDLRGVQADGQNIYWWGAGIGKFDLAMPLLYKLDANGNEIWSTAKDSLLALAGTMTNTIITADAVYCTGISAAGVTFLAKVDKQTGKVVYRRNAIPLNGSDIIGKELQGTDSIRLFATRLESRFVVYSYSFSTATGLFAAAEAPLSTGLDAPGVDIPIYFDTADAFYNVHEPDYTWTIKKKDRATNNTTWTCSVSGPLTNLYREGAYDYFFTANRVRCVLDSTGTSLWTTYLNTDYNDDYDFVSCQTLGDSLYITWALGYIGSERTTMLSKLNKKTGQMIWNEVVGDYDTNNNYLGLSNFTTPATTVDAKGDVYMLGLIESGDIKHIRKLAANSGRLVYDVSIPVDTLSDGQYKVHGSPVGNYVTSSFLMNGKITFVAANRETDRNKSSVHVNFVRLEDPNTGSISRKVYHNNLYQFSSTTLDVQSFRDNFYIIKREGADVFLEKYKLPQQQVWKKRLTAYDRYFNPDRFAIDSLGNICVLGYNEDKPLQSTHTLASYDYINCILVFDSSGTLLKRHGGYIATPGDRRQLVGDVGGGFYFFTQNTYYHIDQLWLDGYSYNNENGIYFNGSTTLNNTQDVLVTADSIFVYSNNPSYFRPAYCMMINKANRKTATKALTNDGGLNGVLRSTAYPSSVYTYGAVFVDDIPTAAVAKMKGPFSPAEWLFQYPGYTITRCLENAKGDIIALLKLRDSVVVTLLDHQTGKPLWLYKKEEDYLTDPYDIAVNNENNTIIVALLAHSDDWADQHSSWFELNASSGSFIKEVTMPGKPGTPNNILFVKNIPGTGILMGGNLVNDSSGGLNGFTFLNTDVAPYEALPCNLHPDFSADTEGADAATIQFTDRTTRANYPLTYNWNFGDGGDAVLSNPKHTYSKSGVYNVCLEVKDSTGCIATFCRDIFIIKCEIKTGFRYELNSSAAGEVHLTNLSTPDSLLYRWDFGDGSFTDSTANPVHTFAAAKNYNVCLTAATGTGCYKTWCDSVMIVAAPAAERLKMTAVPNPVSTTLYLDFDSESAGNATVSVSSSYGEQKYYQVISTVAGRNHVSVPVENLAKGIYFVNLSGKGINSKTKFVKL